KEENSPITTTNLAQKHRMKDQIIDSTNKAVVSFHEELYQCVEKNKVRFPVRAIVQSPRSGAVSSSYVFYNNTFVKENMVLKESEYIQDLKTVDWTPFNLPVRNESQWTLPTPREQKQKKKEAYDKVPSRSVGSYLINNAAVAILN
ncbi:12244_t:CDS:2, partial [Ambispora gerdemannii]